MMDRVLAAALNWLEINHPQAKTYAEQAEHLGLSTQLWHQLSTGGKTDLYLSTVVKILERIGGDLNRALPGYLPELEVLAASSGKRPTLVQTIARARMAESERREAVSIIGEITIAGQVVLEREKIAALDLCLREFPLYGLTEGPTAALRRRESVGGYVVESWFILRSPREDTPLWNRAQLVWEDGSGDLWLCEALGLTAPGSSEPQSWMVRPFDLHHAAWSLDPRGIKGLIIGTLSASWPKSLGKE